MSNGGNGEDPLRELLVDAAEVDRRQIATTLKGRVGIDSKTGRLQLLPGYNQLDARRKVLAVLLARKAAFLLEITDDDALTNKEVTEITGLAAGTAAPSLKSLRELRLVSQGDGKAYFIPNAHLLDVIRFIAGEGQ